jgi:hypothetical protein
MAFSFCHLGTSLVICHLVYRRRWGVRTSISQAQHSEESQGTAANGCCCTVIDVGTTVSPAESHPALATLVPTCTVYGKTPVRKLQLSRTAFRPHNLLFYNTNLSTFNPCNSTELTLHVLTNCQHVSLIMMAKFNHVATVVAGIDFLVKALSLLRLHCCHQWNEDFECSFQQHPKLWQTLAKQSCKIQSNLD